MRPYSKRWGAIVVAILALIVGGCGSGSHHHATALPNGAPKPTLTAPPCHVSPTNGTPGACAPHQPGSLKPTAPRPTATSYPQFVDLSNNDPVNASGMRAIKAHGFVGLYAKVNQATYIDPTYAGMVRDARAAGLKVGGYDFMDPGRASASHDADLFVGRLKATGTCTGKDVMPPTLDVEYGSIGRSQVDAAVAVVRKACGRAQIYTGQWYWNPHVGCYWPSNVSGWISGYPNLYLPCGLKAATAHQYTDRGFNGALSGDVSRFLGTDAQFAAYSGTQPLKPPSQGARDRCREANRLRSHTKHPLTKRQQARVVALAAFFKRNHLSCTRGHVRRVAA